MYKQNKDWKKNLNENKKSVEYYMQKEILIAVYW